jgi:hypothetical protein
MDDGCKSHLLMAAVNFVMGCGDPLLSFPLSPLMELKNENA